jgi:hypothetical protein
MQLLGVAKVADLGLQHVSGFFQWHLSWLDDGN